MVAHVKPMTVLRAQQEIVIKNYLFGNLTRFVGAFALVVTVNC